MDIYNSFGIISSRFIVDEKISNESVSIYSIIRTMFYNNITQHSSLNIQTLYYLVSANSSIGSSVKPIKIALNWLIGNKYIVVKDILKKNNITINYKSNIMNYLEFPKDISTSYYLNDGGFTKIPEYNLNIILNCIHDEEVSKKYAFIRYYLIIARYCSNDNQFGVFSMKRVSTILSVSMNTCVSWNKLLERLGIIYYDSSYGYVNDKGKFIMGNTMYCQRNIEINGKLITKQHFNDCIEEYTKNNNLIKVK